MPLRALFILYFLSTLMLVSVIITLGQDLSKPLRGVKKHFLQFYTKLTVKVILFCSGYVFIKQRSIPYNYEKYLGPGY